eukprot:UN01099
MVSRETVKDLNEGFPKIGSKAPTPACRCISKQPCQKRVPKLETQTTATTFAPLTIDNSRDYNR